MRAIISQSLIHLTVLHLKVVHLSGTNLSHQYGPIFCPLKIREVLLANGHFNNRCDILQKEPYSIGNYSSTLPVGAYPCGRPRSPLTLTSSGDHKGTPLRNVPS